MPKRGPGGTFQNHCFRWNVFLFFYLVPLCFSSSTKSKVQRGKPIPADLAALPLSSRHLLGTPLLTTSYAKLTALLKSRKHPQPACKAHQRQTYHPEHVKDYHLPLQPRRLPGSSDWGRRATYFLSTSGVDTALQKPRDS